MGKLRLTLCFVDVSLYKVAVTFNLFALGIRASLFTHWSTSPWLIPGKYRKDRDQACRASMPARKLLEASQASFSFEDGSRVIWVHSGTKCWERMSTMSIVSIQDTYSSFSERSSWNNFSGISPMLFPPRFLHGNASTLWICMVWALVVMSL